MPPAVDRSPAALSPLSSSGRRLISRFTSPFANKPRNVAEFYVDVTDRYRQYSPGDLVTGSVRLRVSKPTRVTHLTVCLHGYVQVFKNPGAPGEGYKAHINHLGGGRGKKSGEYFGNGFASLFEDEIVLCGDGRLAEGSYQFNFELEFPDKDLPSSIDFERGTISYVITATMTRPTTMSPTMTCDRKIYFVERIDISPLYPPKMRTITLEAISKRSRAKSQARKIVDASDRLSRASPSIKSSDQHRNSEASSAPSGVSITETPASPVPSEISFDSLVSSAERTSQADASRHSHGNSENGTILSNNSSQPRMIVASVESLNGGCLRGDYIGIRVKVQHTKSVKSLYGVIVTLYRQARVDMHPAIPLGPTEKGGSAKYEDYYPRSMTGLGGLSLSGAGSSHVFRKDLSQTTVPLYVNPASLEAEINTKVRVPEEAFPTISTVPGGMISFKYYVEVVVDIQGKLASHDRSFGNLGGLTSSQPMMGSMGTFEGSENERPSAMPFGSSIVDTAQIRRDKGVMTCTFEVVVGTRDSERRKGKRKLEAVPTSQETELHRHSLQGNGAPEAVVEGNVDSEGHHQDQWVQYPPPDDAHMQGHWSMHHHESDLYDDQYEELAQPVPIPQRPEESELSEKARMQRAEDRLLPSQPPDVDEDFRDRHIGPTAPYLPYEDVSYAENGIRPFPMYGASASSVPFEGGHAESISAPGYEPPTAISTRYTTSLDDKQERHRHNLELAASAPPVDDGEDVGSSTIASAHAPSAPPGERAMTRGEDFDSHADVVGSTGLPRYER
nr:ph-response regulator protein palf/rim8 [Quercus suber]